MSVEGLSDAELQELVLDVVRTYAERAEGGLEGPFPPGEIPTPTEVLVLVTDLLEAADIGVFELGMWQTFGGVREGKTEG
jgi:hypothetical protein